MLFYPKFHCELNWIEMVWGRLKWWVQKQCDYTFKGLNKNVPAGLKFVNADLKLLRQFERKADRYGSAYLAGATGRLAEFAVTSLS